MGDSWTTTLDTSNLPLVVNGDCAVVLPKLAADSIDAVVTDPPYGLKFMGRGWDDMGHGNEQQAWHYRWAVEVLRVLKPGGHLLAFGGTRTYHRLASAVEDAGFEVRDQIQWLYGQGFPKSMNVGKAIDKAAGAEREVVGIQDPRSKFDGSNRESTGHSGETVGEFGSITKKGAVSITAPVTPEAVQWEGWGTALKPAHEPIVLARKPFKGTVASNVMRRGVGGLNIDDSRISTEGEVFSTPQSNPRNREGEVGTNLGITGSSVDDFQKSQAESIRRTQELGRWPANVILDPEAGEMLDEQTGELKSGKAAEGGHVYKDNASLRGEGGIYAGGKGLASGKTPGDSAGHPYGDSGGPSRFFYCAKASKSERNAGLEHPVKNNHPTVKPIDLMRYLCRLVTPPGGMVLDPFTGSGTTGIAAGLEGFQFIGIESDLDYTLLAQQRIAHWTEHE